MPTKSKTALKKRQRSLLSSKLNFNNPAIVAVIALVVAVGGYFIYKSFASTAGASVPCSNGKDGFNTFQGNGYRLIKGYYNHYVLASQAKPDYEIVLKCAGGGLGHVWYQNLNHPSTARMIDPVPDSSGHKYGAADIGVAALPAGSFSIVSVQRDYYNGAYTTSLYGLDFTVHGRIFLAAQYEGKSPVPFAHVVKYDYPNRTVTLSDGKPYKLTVIAAGSAPQ